MNLIDCISTKAKDYTTQYSKDNGKINTEDWIKIYNQKFAELIVQECVIVVADAVDHREPASTYVDKIKQHFGVDPDVDENLRNRSTYFGNDI